MKLALRRDQEDIRGTFGGHKGVTFKLTVRAVLDPEEQRLVERYKWGDQILHEWAFTDDPNSTAVSRGMLNP